MLSQRALKLSLLARRQIEISSRLQSVPRRLLATIESSILSQQFAAVTTENASKRTSRSKKLKKVFPEEKRFKFSPKTGSLEVEETNVFPAQKRFKFSPTTGAAENVSPSNPQTRKSRKTFPAARTSNSSPTNTALRRDKNYAYLENTTSVDLKLLEFRSLVNEGQYSQAMQLYHMVIETSTVTKHDTLFVAQLLHYAFRALVKGGSPDPALPEKDDIHRHIQTLVADLKLGRLPSHAVADVHILSYFKESRQFDEGAAFWRWLVEQEDSRLDPRTYGAAIELLAFQGEPLQYLEELYMQALKRFPGQFSEYHLSPRSIIANPNARTYTPGSKMLLLQGILTARVLHGDWLNSYLALDTALRLHPDVLPARFFDLFIYERPLLEAYAVFQIACRSGTRPSPRSLMFLMEQLCTWSGKRPAESFLSFKQRKLRAVLCMIDAVCSYLGVGGELSAAHMNKIIHETLKALPPAQGAKPLPIPLTEESERLDGDLLTAVRSLIDVFGKRGIKPNEVTCNTVVGAAIRLQSPDLVAFFEEWLQPFSELKSNRAFNLLTLKFAKSIEATKAAWENVLSSDYGDNRDQPHLALGTLIKVCSQTDNLEFAQKEVEKLQSTMPPDFALRINSMLEMEQANHAEKSVEPTHSQKLEESKNLETPGMSDDPQTPRATSTQIWDASEPWSGLETLVSQLAFKVEKYRSIANSEKPHDFQKDPISLHLRTSPEREYNDSYMRQLYKVMTTDPNWTGTSSQREDVLRTGFTFAELRYQNWREINELLLEAEVNQYIRERQVDQAILDGRALAAETDRSSIGVARTEAKLRIIEKRCSPLYQPDLPSTKGLTIEEALSRNKLPTWIQNVIRWRGYEGKIPQYPESPEATLLSEKTSELSLAGSPESSPLEGSPQLQADEDGEPTSHKGTHGGPS